jgi:hypothetical protein
MVDSGSHYEIQTPSAVALVRGTRFLTEVSEAGETRVHTTEGLVSVTAQGGGVFVPAGEQTTVETGAAPSEPVIASDTGDEEPPEWTQEETANENAYLNTVAAQGQEDNRGLGQDDNRGLGQDDNRGLGQEDNRGLGQDGNRGLGQDNATILGQEDNRGLGQDDNRGLGQGDNRGLGQEDNRGLGQDDNRGLGQDNKGQGNNNGEGNTMDSESDDELAPVDESPPADEDLEGQKKMTTDNYSVGEGLIIGGE